MVRLPGDLNAARRLDAVHLDRQFRSGRLTDVSVPDLDQEAVRHLVRAHLFNPTGRSPGPSTGPLQTVLTSELQHLEYLEASLRSLEAEITEISVQPPWREPVEALCCFRGVRTLTAMTHVSEIGDIKRFGSPRQLRATSAWCRAIAAAGNAAAADRSPQRISA